MSIRTVLMIVSLVVSVAIGLVLARGGGGATAKVDRAGRKVRIGLSLDTLKEARWQADRDAFVNRANELGAEVLVQAANSDDLVQMRDIQTLIGSDIDVLVIVAHDGVAMAEGVKKAHEAKIPVIAYDRMIQEKPDLYISFDNFEIGRMQARAAMDAIGGRGTIVRIFGHKADNNATLFKQGQDEVLAPYLKDGRVTILTEDWALNWAPEEGKRIMTSAISANQGKKIDAVIASNDGTAGGAIAALTEDNLAGKVVVTGQDAELVALQRIAAGTQYMTVYKPLKKLAGEAAETAVKMANREVIIATGSAKNEQGPVAAVISPTVVVTKDNIKQTVVADGFHSEADIYGGAK